MRALNVICLLALPIFGCQSSREAHDASLAEWNAADTSIQERVKAAARLVPKGSKQVVAEEILGTPTRRERFHGPIIYAPGYKGSTNATSVDIWRDVYDFADGDYVYLTFDIEASRSKWEDRPRLSVGTGNTIGGDRIILNPINTSP
jgi:hypothetical protein